LAKFSSADKLAQLEGKLHQSENEKAAFAKLVKDLENKERQQGWELARLEEESHKMGKMNNMVDDLRVWKSKVRKLNLAQSIDDRSKAKEEEMMVHLDDQTKKIEHSIEVL
jgi:hypothetical protein